MLKFIVPKKCQTKRHFLSVLVNHTMPILHWFRVENKINLSLIGSVSFFRFLQSIHDRVRDVESAANKGMTDSRGRWNVGAAAAAADRSGDGSGVATSRTTANERLLTIFHISRASRRRRLKITSVRGRPSHAQFVHFDS